MKRFIFLITVSLASYAETNVWTPLAPYGGYVSALVADPSNPGTLYTGTGGVAGAPGGLYKTTDGGTNWTLLNRSWARVHRYRSAKHEHDLCGTTRQWKFRSLDVQEHECRGKL